MGTCWFLLPAQHTDLAPQEDVLTQRLEEPRVSGPAPHRFPICSLNFRALRIILRYLNTWPEVPSEASGRPFKTSACTGRSSARSAELSKFRSVSRGSLCSRLPVLVSLRSRGLGMRSRLLLNVARCLWTRRTIGPARRYVSCGTPQLEELFARGGPLRTYLERQAGSESQLQFRGAELVAVAKLLSEKEQELQETEHLLHGKGRAQGSGIQSRFLTLRLPFPLSSWSGGYTLPEFEALYSIAAFFGLDQRSKYHVRFELMVSCLSLCVPLTQCPAPFYRT